MSAVTSSLVTVEQYEQLPEEEWRKYELSEGELVPRYGDEMSARPSHNWIRDAIIASLFNYLRQNPVGRSYSEQDFQLSEGIVRRPDVAVILDHRLGILDNDPAVVPGAPDLAVEVISPSNRADDVEKKIRQLLRAGCKAVWVLFVDQQAALVCSDDGRFEKSIEDVLEAPDMLPGFQLELRELFGSLKR